MFSQFRQVVSLVFFVAPDVHSALDNGVSVGVLMVALVMKLWEVDNRHAVMSSSHICNNNDEKTAQVASLRESEERENSSSFKIYV